MANFLIMTIQVSLVQVKRGEGNTNSPELSSVKILALACHFLAMHHLGFHIFFHNGLFEAAYFFYSWAVLD